MKDAPAHLLLDGVQKRFGAVVALDGVGLRAAEGSRTAIVGPSGSGKTTLLRVVAGFEAPDAGRIMLGDRVMAEGGTSVPAYRRGIGVVAQDGALFPHLDVRDNIGFGLPRDTPGREARVAALMRMVELDLAMLHRRPDELSGGQQQRVALARALARQPRLMLLDEPFSALDTGLRASTRHAVAEVLRRAGITTVLVTHDQAEALSFADQVAVLRNGRLEQAGTPQEVYFRPVSRAVAEFLGDAVVLPATVAGGVAECALGRVAVARDAPSGAATIMLRPEQIGLEPDTSGLGEVGASEFAGAACTYVVRLLGAAGAVLTIRQPGTLALQVGMRVRLVVSGTAHMLGDGAL